MISTLFVFISFSYCFVLQVLMQKFLSLGNECVKIQEMVDASQGMFTMNFDFFLLCVLLASPFSGY
jgi:hypothetical protein